MNFADKLVILVCIQFLIICLSYCYLQKWPVALYWFGAFIINVSILLMKQ